MENKVWYSNYQIILGEYTKSINQEAYKKIEQVIRNLGGKELISRRWSDSLPSPIKIINEQKSFCFEQYPELAIIIESELKFSYFRPVSLFEKDRITGIYNPRISIAYYSNNLSFRRDLKDLFRKIRDKCIVNSKKKKT